MKNSKHRIPRLYAIVLSVIFVASVSLPGLSLLHSVFSATERARHFPLNGNIDLALPKAMRGQYKLQVSYDQLRYRIFGMTPRAVLVGLHGDLYYDSDAVQDSSTIADLRGRKRYTPDQIQVARKYLARKQFLADSMGFDYLAAMAPNKTSAYPFHLPDSLRHIREVTCWKATLPRLDGILRRPILDLWPAQIDSLHPKFYKTDTHWNDEGALEAYFAIAHAMGWTPLDTTGWTRDSIDYSGDLLYLAYLENTVHERTLRIRPKTTGHARNRIGKPILYPQWEFPEVSHLFEGELARGAHSWTTNPLHAGDTAIVFHDCYMSFLQPYLAEHLGHVYWVWGRFDEDLVKKVRPRVVLEVRAERYLSFLLGL